MCHRHDSHHMTHTTTINLHAQPNRGEVDDMIWEVDEDCDGMVSWLEFQTMYTRCAWRGGHTWRN